MIQVTARKARMDFGSFETTIRTDFDPSEIIAFRESGLSESTNPTSKAARECGENLRVISEYLRGREEGASESMFGGCAFGGGKTQHMRGYAEGLAQGRKETERLKSELLESQKENDKIKAELQKLQDAATIKTKDDVAIIYDHSATMIDCGKPPAVFVFGMPLEEVRRLKADLAGYDKSNQRLRAELAAEVAKRELAENAASSAQAFEKQANRQFNDAANRIAGLREAIEILKRKD